MPSWNAAASAGLCHTSVRAKARNSASDNRLDCASNVTGGRSTVACQQREGVQLYETHGRASPPTAYVCLYARARNTPAAESKFVCGSQHGARIAEARAATLPP